jgi:hypothetical protein
MATEPIPFRFIYEPEDDSNELDAYDAGQALWGISRSLSIVTHYLANGKVIKQAPALSGARIVLYPPRTGSFEFLFQVIPIVGPEAVELGRHLVAHVLYDLVKLVYLRATGQRDAPETGEIENVARRFPGDVDAINDTIDDDVVRIHRPIAGGGVNIINIYGGTNTIGTLNQQTLEYASARELGPSEEEFVGNVASFNGNTENGRLFIATEQRTVAFRRDRTLVHLPQADRVLLSHSLDQYVRGRLAEVRLIGRALRDRAGKIKIIFVTGVTAVG